MIIMPLYESVSLLSGGKNAFPEIIRCIDGARESIVINMFIWRADNIGCRIADALIRAADRGVKVSISVDRYGMVLEKCEECTHSFFHESPTLTESIKIASLKVLYPSLHPDVIPEDTHRPLLERMLEHENITVSRDIFKADHSKYYVFDDEVLIMGGVNIEDKENGADISGRVYGDYMVKFVGRDIVTAFYEKLRNGKDVSRELRFTVNSKEVTPRLFEMESVYLDIINSAEKKLVIVMAYFSPLEKFVDAIVNAHLRGVDVTVMIPEHANFQDDLNRKTVSKLLKRSDGGITVKLSPKMLHTKLMYSEKTLSMGSSNITKKAFDQLSELNLTVVNDGSEFVRSVIGDVDGELSAARFIGEYKDVKYRRLMAWLEGFVV